MNAEVADEIVKGPQVPQSSGPSEVFIPLTPVSEMFMEKGPSRQRTAKNPSYRHKNVAKNHTRRTIFEHLTTLAQACMFLFVSLISCLCFSGEFVLFTWHPLLLAVGVSYLFPLKKHFYRYFIVVGLSDDRSHFSDI